MLLDQGWNPCLQASTGGFFTTEPPGKPNGWILRILSFVLRSAKKHPFPGLLVELSLDLRPGSPSRMWTRGGMTGSGRPGSLRQLVQLEMTQQPGRKPSWKPGPTSGLVPGTVWGGVGKSWALAYQMFQRIPREGHRGAPPSTLPHS